jgi:hypothetical protein
MAKTDFIQSIYQMTDKDLVLREYPEAKPEKLVSGNFVSYWTISTSPYNKLGYGDTEEKAWKAAKDFIKK